MIFFFLISNIVNCSHFFFFFGMLNQPDIPGKNSTYLSFMNCSRPGLPVHHQLPEFTQIHIHRVSDAIQPSHPLLFPFPPIPNPSQHQSFSNESLLCIRWPKYWSFSFSISPSNKHPGLVFFRMDWLDLLAV